MGCCSSTCGLSGLPAHCRGSAGAAGMSAGIVGIRSRGILGGGWADEQLAEGLVEVFRAVQARGAGRRGGGSGWGGGGLPELTCRIGWGGRVGVHAWGHALCAVMPSARHCLPCAAAGIAHAACLQAAPRPWPCRKYSYESAYYQFSVRIQYSILNIHPLCAVSYSLA